MEKIERIEWINGKFMCVQKINGEEIFISDDDVIKKIEQEKMEARENGQSIGSMCIIFGFPLGFVLSLFGFGLFSGFLIFFGIFLMSCYSSDSICPYTSFYNAHEHLYDETWKNPKTTLTHSCKIYPIHYDSDMMDL